MTITQTITAPTTAPARTQDKDTFNTNVDNRLAWEATNVSELTTWTAQVNAFEIAGTLTEVQDTSVTSNSIGTGSKTFTITAGKSFVIGMNVSMADTAAPATNYMQGIITSYSSTTLIVNSTVAVGSGTKTAWTIAQAPITPVSLTGVETLSPSVNTELSASVLVHEIAPTVGHLAMTLVSAADNFVVGTVAAIIKNTGTFAFTVATKDGGKLLGSLEPQHTMTLVITSKGTADGNWNVQISKPHAYLSDLTLLVGASLNGMSACRITDNRVAYFYPNPSDSNYITAVCVTETDGVSVVGTPVRLAATAIGFTDSCSTDANNESIVVAISSSGNNAHAYFVTWSGSVPTLADTETNLVAGAIHASYPPSVIYVSTDLFLLAYQDTTGYLQSIAFPTSGTTIGTKGSVVQVYGAASYYPRLCRLADNVVVVTYTEASIHVVGNKTVLTGTTITAWGAQKTLISSVPQAQVSWPMRLSDTKFAVFASDSDSSGIYHIVQTHGYTTTTIDDRTQTVKSRIPGNSSSTLYQGRPIELKTGIFLYASVFSGGVGSALHLWSVDSNGRARFISETPIALNLQESGLNALANPNTMVKLRDGVAAFNFKEPGSPAYQYMGIISGDVQ